MAIEIVAGAAVALAIIGVLLVRDASHRRQLEALKQELARANAKIAERRSLTDVGEMVSGLAQELKTPLQEVLGSTELMLATSLGTKGERAPSTEELRQLRQGVERAAGIVRNLVAYTETVSLSRRWHDVKEILDRAVAAARRDLDARGIRVEQAPMERMPLVYVDGRQLEKVLASFIARPARAEEGRVGSPPRQVTVTISAMRVATPDDRVVFSISDNGPSRDDHAGGLAAARRVVEAHGGSLTASSPGSGPGVLVTIELPIAAAASAAQADQEKPRPWTESSTSSTSIANGTSTS